MFDDIQSCISGYLIQSAYLKSRQKYTNEKTFQIREIEEDDYIALRLIGSGSSSNVELIYEIDSGGIYIIKKPKELNDETYKLNNREFENYLNINYSKIPKLYGTITIDGYKNLIIEYIEGKTLLNIETLHLSNDEKILIIFQLLLIIQYLHEHNFVYRDLKPNNVILNEEKILFLIDLDRVINLAQFKKENGFTVDFQSPYIAPEVFDGNISFKNDVYSIGQMIYYIFNEKDPNKQKIQFGIKNEEIEEVYRNCIQFDYSKRPTIFEIIIILFNNYSTIINNSKIKNFPEVEYLDGLNKINDEYIIRDINKAIQFYTFESNQNNTRAQIELAFIYSSGKFIKQDINKAIYYYTIIANKNIKEAQYILGDFFYSDEFNARDIKKAIHYFTLSANNNYRDAQYILGEIYYNNKFIARDINRAIHYFTLAAKLNHPKAQYMLFCIYFECKYITRDYEKAFYYLTLAANQNFPEALFDLGMFYIDRILYFNYKYIPKDINKGVYYLTLAADKNYVNAQYVLGIIYLNCNPQNINKAIHYLSLAAKQNDPFAQIELGIMYAEGKLLSKNIQKANNYFSSAGNIDVPVVHFQIGLIYFDGIYVVKDINKAIYHFSLASEKNYADAQLYLGLIYYNDSSIKSDINKSIYYLTQAANQNNTKANYLLGFIILKTNIFHEILTNLFNI